jgi:hypothetical protein
MSGAYLHFMPAGYFASLMTQSHAGRTQGLSSPSSSPSGLRVGKAQRSFSSLRTLGVCPLLPRRPGNRGRFFFGGKDG